MSIKEKLNALKTRLKRGEPDLGERVIQIAMDAQANGIPIDPADFASKSLSPYAVRGLIEMGKESGVVGSKDLNTLSRFVAQKTGVAVK